MVKFLDDAKSRFQNNILIGQTPHIYGILQIALVFIPKNSDLYCFTMSYTLFSIHMQSQNSVVHLQISRICPILDNWILNNQKTRLMIY